MLLGDRDGCYSVIGINVIERSGSMKICTKCVQSSDVVNTLLDSGASMQGKTITEELAFSLIGNNRHFPIPRNGATSNRFCGGSSSGSASAVSCDQVDFALGTDTAGSIRVPASNCGLYGLRPSFGAASMNGVMPLAPSFDTLGWLSKSAGIMSKVTSLLASSEADTHFEGYYLYKPAFSFLSDKSRAICMEQLAKSPFPCLGECEEQTSWTEFNEELVDAFRILQTAEAWATHGDWVISQPADTLSQDILQRFLAAKQITNAAINQANDLRKRLKEMFDELLCKYGLIVFPTVSQIAPVIGVNQQRLDRYRLNILRTTCMSSLTGLPEMTLPILKLDSGCLGISLLGKRGSDKAITSFVASHVID